jgi:sugar phosphate isomerase/epimerase
MNIPRRDFICTALAGTALLTANNALKGGEVVSMNEIKSPRICINTSTIREAKIPLDKLIPMIKGYGSIEPWINEIDDYVKSGKKLVDLKKQIADQGLVMESAIGFPQWCVDDDAQREKGFEEAKRCMGLVAELGGHKIAAPPAGASSPKSPQINLDAMGERYAKLIELGEQMGVMPQLEIWGPSKNLSKVSEAVYVATSAGHPKARLLLDAYHIFRGGSSFHSMKMIAGSAMDHFHINDYPAEPTRLEQNDSHRVYPGDGVAPLVETIASMLKNGFKGSMALELFNKEYYKQDPQLVLDTGYQKCKTVIDLAILNAKENIDQK